MTSLNAQVLFRVYPIEPSIKQQSLVEEQKTIRPVIRPNSDQNLIQTELEAKTKEEKKQKSAFVKNTQRVASPPAPTSQNLIKNKKNKKDNYNEVSIYPLGVGAFSEVRLVEEIETHNQFAMKVMEKEKLRRVSQRMFYRTNIGNERSSGKKRERYLECANSPRNNQNAHVLPR
jgi:hypothetical protein